MAEHSKIEWTDTSWTPIRARNKATGKIGWHCTKPSTGCANCYAESMNKWRGTGLPFAKSSTEQVEVFLDDRVLRKPLAWRKPRMVFACSMTDLFGEFVTNEMIDQVFAVMALCPQHTFQVLTKRPERMAEYLIGDRGAFKFEFDHTTSRDWWDMAVQEIVTPERSPAREQQELILCSPRHMGYPHLPNVWLGTSCENQQTAVERIPHLLRCPAAVRFVSREPMISEVNYDEIDLDGIDWFIWGGESGPSARPNDADWIRRELVATERYASAFVKQLGSRCVAWGHEVKFADKGGNMGHWPGDLRVREWPTSTGIAPIAGTGSA